MIDRESPNAFASDQPETEERTRAETAIEDVRCRGGVFVEAVRATRMAMVLTDPALPGNPVVFANQSFLELSGYAMDEVLGQQPYFLNGPDTDARDAARFREALIEDRDETLETVQYRKDGSRIVASLLVTAIKDEAGRTLHHLLSWRDITRQVEAETEAHTLRQAEAGVRESEARQAFLLRFSDALRAEPSADAVGNRALQMLSEQMGLDRCYVGIYRLAENIAVFPYQVHDDRLAPLPAQVPLSDFPEALRVVSDRTLVIDDVVEAELSASERASFDGLNMRALIVGTLRKGENIPLWAICAVSARPRVWTQSEVALVEDVAERTWAAVERARADAALRESEDRYRTLFEAIDSGFCIIEMIFGEDGRAIDYRFVEANPAFERQSGLVDAIGHRIREFAPNLEEHWFERYGRVALTGEALHVEGEAAPLGRWFDINAFRVGAPEQRRVAVLFTDISDRKHGEAALRTSQEQFETLLNQAPVGVYLVDSDFVIRHVNPVALPVFGDIAGGPVGRDFDEVIHLLWDKDYADEVVRIFRHTLETGVPFVTSERAEHRTDRDTIEYYEWRLDRMQLPDGRYGVVCYFRDISAQVHARQEIETAHALARESEERFRLAIDGSKIAIYECDLDLRYTWITNPVEGFTPDDIVGRLDRDLLSEKDAALLERFKRQALASEDPLEEEMYASPGGEPRWFLMRAERLRDAHRKVIGLRVVSLDITDSKRNEAARRESEARLAMDLADTRVLQAAGAAMIDDSRGEDAEQAILSAAVAIMRSDAASIQMLDPATDQLVLLGHRGFHPDSARFWQRVTRGSGGTCGQAFNERRRIIIEDVREDEVVRNSEDLQSYQMSGIVAVQTTPLITRAGKLIGMMSTHWRHRHRPDERQFGHFDVLARQAADLIEWRSTQAALRDSEERLRLIVESARDYAIFTTDQDDIIDEWLPGAQTVFGFTKEEAEGQPAAILYTAEDRALGQPEKEVETARREGKASDVRWHVRKGGERVFIEGQVVPLRSAAGDVQGFLKIGQDVTERRLAEQALRDSDERFRQFGDASSDLLWIRNAETLAFEYLSPAFERLYGVPCEQVIAANDVKAWAELIHPDDRDLGIDLLRKLRSGVPGSYEFRVVRPDGSTCWLLDTNFPLRDDSGKVVRIAGIAQDITERKRAVELQGTLLAELQHRVRNILALIQSVVRRTLETSESPEEYARHLGGRIAAMARTQALLTRSPGRLVDLEEVLRDELLSVAAQEESYWCEGPEVNLPPKAAEVLTLAIHELATNSVKYGAFSRPGGQLEIRWALDTREAQQWLVFEWEESRVRHDGFAREGFGTELITRRVPYELRGKGSITPAPDGMIATIEFPLVRSNSILETNMPEQVQ
jgi:PAS domain S-box-containing protein